MSTLPYLERLTTDEAILTIFDKYQNDPSIVNTIELPTIQHIHDILRGKHLIDGSVKQLRTDCATRLDTLSKLERREVSARNDLDKLRMSLGRLYDLVTDAVKRIDGRKHDINVELRAVGRVVGLAVNDLPVVQTQMFTVDAIRNIIAANSTIHYNAKICDEHFWSLYTYGGPKIVELAMKNKRNLNFAKFLQAVYGYNQTAKTTKDENYRLAEYHKTHDLITPQVSYSAVGVSPLVYCPKQLESKVMMMWRFMHEEHGLDYIRSPHKPFDHCLTFDQAVELYPDLEPARKILRLP